jgi:hypothetical protein
MTESIVHDREQLREAVRGGRASRLGPGRRRLRASQDQQAVVRILGVVDAPPGRRDDQTSQFGPAGSIALGIQLRG